MDDNTEVNMDTDVSSTTADVPDTEDVTGSNSQVETVIEVEKLDEGTEKEMSSAIANELSQDEYHNEVELESSFIRSPSDEVSTNDSDVKEVQNTSEIVESNNVSPIAEQVTTDSVKDEKIQDQVTTTKSSPTKLSQAICDLRTEAENVVDSFQNISPVDTVSNLDETPIIPEIAIEKKSPIKKLEMEDIQTTFIEISKGSDEINTIKKEEAPSSVDTCEKSNDSQVDSISDVSEKDHIRNISRELKSLMKSAKESKIISECNQLTSKTRKSRCGLDSSSSTISSSPSMDVEKVHRRRHSNNSQLSNSSEQSEKAPMKRSMRSQNPEFVNKVKQFLNSVTGKHQKSDSDDEADESNKHKSNTMYTSAKRKRQTDTQLEAVATDDGKARSDKYCWRCHWQVDQVANEKSHAPMHCTVCPRSYHFKCMTLAERNKIETDKSWVCPECLSILYAESSETRSPSMKKITMGGLRELLQHALQRMMELNGVEPFLNPVDRSAFPDYDKYVVNPMDLTMMKQNVAAGVYGSTEAFTADVQWILHNSVIFNTLQSKLTGGARALVRTCRSEMGEIEACPECYAAAHARRPTWFIDVCTTPHILLWAKLKGFPFWPAKGMSVNSSGLVDVRFFGAHDRAWVPARDCYLYSEKDPNNFRTKRQDIIDSMQEAEHHIRNISRKYGKFVYPPFKTSFDPTKLNEHLKAMIPSFEGEIKSSFKEKANTSLPLTPKNKRRSGSKSSKNSNHDGENSESEDSQILTRKMADGVEIAPEEEDFAVDKDSSIEVDTPNKEEENRKRRRSLLEEAVITIIESSSSAKKKRLDEVMDVKLDTSTNRTKSDNKEIKQDAKPKSETPSTSIKEVKEAQTSTAVKVSEKTPIKTVIKIRASKPSTPKEKDNKAATPKQKPTASVERVATPDNSHIKSVKRTEKRKSSKHSPPSQVTVERRSSDKRDRDANTSKERHSVSKKETDSEKSNSGKSKESDSKTSKKSKNTSEGSSVYITRDSPKSNGLPTISSVRSLSQQAPSTSSKTIEITVEAKSDSSVFTPTSTDNVRNSKEAANKLGKLKSEKPAFGRLGVRAFARMKSPEKAKESIEVEIKSEPIDFDDADRQSEKMDLMTAFCLRPVNPPAVPKLRDVRINKVVSGPSVQNTQAKTIPKPPEPRPKARKSFPQPRKPDEGRSELNGKNSMVYIPIQPPTTQAPVRQVRPVGINAGNSVLRPPMPTATVTSNESEKESRAYLMSTNANCEPKLVSGNVNTVTAPVMPVVTSSPAIPTSAPALAMPPKSSLPVGQLPTVHTVPYITSVNGQCFFSLQPIMSVGGVENPAPTVVGDVAAPVLGAPTLGAPTLPVLQAPMVTAQLNGSDDADKRSQELQASQMPRLQQRPMYYNPMDPAAPNVPATQSAAGPITAKLNQHAAKMSNFFRNLLEDSIERWDDPSAQMTSLKLQLETLKWRSQQEVKEIKHNYDLTISEMRGSFEKEKARAVAEAWRSAHVEMEAAVKAAKAKQWCANCSQEAHYYCCWNTAYCDYPCQRAHWKQHFAVCAQERSQDNSNGNCSNMERRLQAAPDNVPTLQKSTAAPAMTVGGKVAPIRVSSTAKEQTLGPNKSSIILSMVEDKNGSPTLNCVGTYKAGASQISPLILNNQIMNNEENSQKKVVTSGGYLIVGSGSNTPLVTPRRTQTIQYYQ